MADDRTVLEHLLQGREALQREVERLTSAIAELDAVINDIGGAGQRVGPVIGVEPDGGDLLGSRDVEPLQTSRGLAKRATLSTGADTGEPPNSIRVRNAGIRAHDDAVRLITIKLMKDGRVERVGRGQYRLARPGAPGAIALGGSLGEQLAEAQLPDAVADTDEFAVEPAPGRGGSRRGGAGGLHPAVEPRAALGGHRLISQPGGRRARVLSESVRSRSRACPATRDLACRVPRC